MELRIGWSSPAPFTVIILLALLSVKECYGEAQFQANIMTGNSGCNRDQMHRCIKIGDPLLRNPDYVFPSNSDDINSVCRLWKELAECVRGYSSNCLNGDLRQQLQLQSAVEEASRSVDEMCNNPIYQADYLRHAPCIKSMATEDGRCKRQLAYLVDQVSALSISNKQTCCAHHSFRECMLSSTYRHCGRSTPMDGSGPTAVQFSRDMFSKSLAFLFKQCEDYLPNSSDCPAVGVTSQDVWESTPGGQQPPSQDISFSSSGSSSNTRPIGFLSNNLAGGQLPQQQQGFNEFNLPPTTRRSNFAWGSASGQQQQTTVSSYRPWFPGGSNSLDSPKQQGLFSGANSISFCNSVIISLMVTILLAPVILL